MKTFFFHCQENTDIHRTAVYGLRVQADNLELAIAEAFKAGHGKNLLPSLIDLSYMPKIVELIPEGVQI